MTRKNKNLIGLSILLIGFVFYTKINYYDRYQPQEGDFLFQDLDCGPTCDAIEAVTWGVDSTKFSHIGFVVIDSGMWKVLEAITSGVALTPIDEFINRSKDANGNPKIWVGRLDIEYNNIIEKVINSVHNYIGENYDPEFIYDNGKYYCSELIYDIFKDSNNGNPVFELEPMTFKSLKNDNYFPGWVEYYRKLNLPIPQDSLGINPAGISRFKKMIIVRELGEVQK